VKYLKNSSDLKPGKQSCEQNANLSTISGPEHSILKSQDMPVPKAETLIHLCVFISITQIVTFSMHPDPNKLKLYFFLYPQHLLIQLVNQSREADYAVLPNVQNFRCPNTIKTLLYSYGNS
jgi:hypothetical protein